MFQTKIPLYGIFLLIGIVLGIFIVYKNSKIIKLSKEELVGLFIYILVGSIMGGKLYSFLTNPLYYNYKFNIFEIGLSSYGAVIGIFIMFLIFSNQFNKSFKELIYIALPAIPLMYGVGKIGCFFAGCCYEIKYDGSFHVIYNYSVNEIKGLSLFPVQIVEAIVFIIIFVYLYNKVKNNKPSNKIIGEGFIICGVFKFLLDYLRMSHVGVILSSNQIVSMVFILLGIYLIYIEKRKIKL